MPFHDRHWEELQRDCDVFPAYSDYLYGPDGRLVVTQEPGLHPLVYPAQPLYRQPQPAFVASQTPFILQKMYQSPEQRTQSPYYSILQTPRQQSQRRPSQSTPGPSHTHSPSLQQTQQLPQISPSQQSQPFTHLHANINRHIPKVWYCLQLVKQAPELLSENTMADQQAAHNWLLSFKQSLPPEGHRYMVQVVSWLYSESRAGRDPLASMGHKLAEENTRPARESRGSLFRHT